MNKAELLENYTAEQLAEVFIKAYNGDPINQIVVNVGGLPKIYPIKEVEEIVRAYEEIKMCQERNEQCKTALPAEYLKVLALDQKVTEMQSEIESLKEQLTRSHTTITQIDEILEELFGVTHDEAKPGEFKEILREKVNERISDFLPTEPIKIADVLISAEGEYERHPIAKAICGTDKGTYQVFDVADLRQIAEHLLVYCNHHEEER